jgi:hypothetical protein
MSLTIRSLREMIERVSIKEVEAEAAAKEFWDAYLQALRRAIKASGETFDIPPEVLEQIHQTVILAFSSGAGWAEGERERRQRELLAAFVAAARSSSEPTPDDASHAFN